MEEKVLGSVSTEFDLDMDVMFEKFQDKNCDSSEMFDFIRAEYLNLIIARKQFVKDGKEKIKEERKQKKEKAK